MCGEKTIESTAAPPRASVPTALGRPTPTWPLPALGKPAPPRPMRPVMKPVLYDYWHPNIAGGAPRAAALWRPCRGVCPPGRYHSLSEGRGVALALPSLAALATSFSLILPLPLRLSRVERRFFAPCRHAGGDGLRRPSDRAAYCVGSSRIDSSAAWSAGLSDSTSRESRERGRLRPPKVHLLCIARGVHRNNRTSKPYAFVSAVRGACGISGSMPRVVFSTVDFIKLLFTPCCAHARGSAACVVLRHSDI